MSTNGVGTWRGKDLRLTLGLVGVLVLTLLGTQATGVLGRYKIDVATTLLTFVALSQAWNILAGFAGQFSLGVSAFVGTGAYAAGIVQIHLGAGYLTATLAAGAAGGVLSLLLAYPLLRLRGDYFSIGTLAAALALQAWLLNWSFAGGSTGLSLPLAGLPDGAGVFRLSCLIAGLAMGTALFVSRSRFGLRLKAVRDNEHAAGGLGVSVFRHRLVALLLHGVLIGLAGGVIALQQASFEPGGMLALSWTINALLMTIVGGLGTVFGPVVGAVVVYNLLTKQLSGHPTLSLIIEGLLLIVIVRFAPRGLWPLFTDACRRVGRSRHRRAEPARPSTAPEPVVYAEPTTV
jgi:branched-chain amino acid transport system permease protein